MTFCPRVFMSVEHGTHKQKFNSCIWQGSPVHTSFTAINFDAHKIYTFNINHTLSPVSTVK